MKKIKGESLNILENKLTEVKKIFPEVFIEEKIDIKKLKYILNEHVETEVEKYDFTWNGKKEALKISQKPTTGTLRPDKEKSKDWNSTKNVYIEGDNLEALKILQKSYHNKIKMIYIDPPYNTGKDFVYKDNYRDNIKNYLEYTGQVDDQGNKMSTNTESSGRYHTDWLNMMYPRLRLARNLLAEDGAIFISIDDNEVHNLRKICDEIFYEDNFIGQIIRKTKSMVGDEGSGFSKQHETLLIYAKNKKNLVLIGDEKNFKNYSNSDNDPNGDWCSGDPSAKSGGATTNFEIKNPYTGKIDLPPKGRYWAFSKTTMDEYIVNGRIKFKKNHADNERGFIFKRYKNNLKNIYNPLISIFAVENKYMNQNGKKDLEELDMDILFDYPKPLSYIKKLVHSMNDKNSIILDFFAGSSTTAHAVMSLNVEDNGNRKYIMVQLPEETGGDSEAYKAGYKTISDIGRERIIKAGEKIKKDYKDKNGIEDLDTGFKAFKLDSSNIKEWNPYYKDVDLNFESLVDNFIEGRKQEDILYEIILKSGLDLTTDVREYEVNQKSIYSLNLGELYICLEDEIDGEIVNKIVDLNKNNDIEASRVIFKDIGFKDDETKLNTKLTLINSGIGEVLSI